MNLTSIASAFPSHQLTQQEAWQTAMLSPKVAALNSRARYLIEKILTGDSGIDTRRFAVENPSALFDLSAGELNQLFEREAPRLSEQALSKALDKASLLPGDIDALFVCTCTGYLCPGISSYLAERMGMRPDTYLNDIVGLGCGAAVPTLRAADGFISANPSAKVAVVAVETCSAAFFINNDLGVLISLCLFGDGASASIWGSTPGDSGFRANHFHTLHLPEHREKIRFVNDQGKLRNQLHRSVPALAGSAVKKLYDKRTTDSPRVITHTGGRDVIDAIEKECALGTIKESRDVLRNYGNTSSPSVLIAMEEALKKDDLDDDLWMTSFGAGFACHSFEMSR